MRYLQKQSFAHLKPSKNSSRIAAVQHIALFDSSRDRRMAKQRKHFYETMKLEGLRIDIEKDASRFYNSLDKYAHLFSSSFVSLSWFSIPSLIYWLLNEVLLDQNIPASGWEGKRLTLPDNVDNPGTLIFDMTVMTAPLVTTQKYLNPEDDRHELRDLMMFYFNCSREEAVKGFLIMFTDAIIKNIIAQGICSIRKFSFAEHLL